MRSSQNFAFLGLKNLSPGQFLGASTDGEDIIDSQNSLLQLKNQLYGSKIVCGVFVILNLKWVMSFKMSMSSWVKSKIPYILLNKNINFNKNETVSIMENPTHNFRDTSLALAHVIIAD